jgi:hypothetical protein
MLPPNFWPILFDWPNGIVVGNLIASFMCWLVGAPVFLWHYLRQMKAHREQIAQAHNKIDELVKLVKGS